MTHVTEERPTPSGTVTCYLGGGKLTVGMLARIIDCLNQNGECYIRLASQRDSMFELATDLLKMIGAVVVVPPDMKKRLDKALEVKL